MCIRKKERLSDKRKKVSGDDSARMPGGISALRKLQWRERAGAFLLGSLRTSLIERSRKVYCTQLRRYETSASFALLPEATQLALARLCRILCPHTL